jgi:hypothetical protein
MRKANIAALIFTVAAAVLIFTQCQRDKVNPFTETKSYHDFVNFKRLSRVEQVKACGKCHQEIYENEMNGPHARAYQNLLAHAAFVNSNQYDCKAYCAQVNEVLPHCTECHTGGNLFETVFKNNPDEQEVMAGIDHKVNYGAVSRDSATLITGVDCITCHYNGKNVVTTMDFVKSPAKTDCPDYCNPEKSGLFTSNINCYPCHQEQVVTMAGYPTKPASCNSCHEEKNANGKYTHYTYWAHNPPGKKIPEQLNIFQGVAASYSESNNAVKVTWNNGLLPHVRSVCTELVAVVEVTQNNKHIKSDTIRINRKPEHAKGLTRWFKGNPVPGVPGTEFASLSDSIVRYITLPASVQTKGLQVNITGFKKEQYWLSDSIRTIYLQKTIPVQMLMP